MIIFKNIKWQNFLSTGNNPIEINFIDTKTTVMLGDSGAGKSTMLDAISFGLFNKPFRNVKKNQLINSMNEKNCLVELEFMVGSKNYKIIRGIKPNIFEIYEEGSLVHQDAKVLDYQNYLETQILRFNYKSFTQIVVLGAANFIPFMQLPAGDRRSIIEELLNIQIFSKMSDILKSKQQELKAHKEAVKTEYTILKSEYDIHFEYSEKKKAEKIKSITETTAKIKELAVQYKHNQESIESTESYIKAAEDQIKLLDFSEKEIQLNFKLKELLNIKEELETSLMSVVKQKSENKYDGELSSFLNSIEKNKNSLDKIKANKCVLTPTFFELNDIKAKKTVTSNILEKLKTNPSSSEFSFQIKIYEDEISRLNKRLEQLTPEQLDSTSTSEIIIHKRDIKKIEAEKEFYTENHHCPECDQEISETHKKKKVKDFDDKIKNLEREIAAAEIRIQYSMDKTTAEIKSEIGVAESGITKLKKEMSEKIEAEIKQATELIIELDKNIEYLTETLEKETATEIADLELKIKLESDKHLELLDRVKNQDTKEKDDILAKLGSNTIDIEKINQELQALPRQELEVYKSALVKYIPILNEKTTIKSDIQTRIKILKENLDALESTDTSPEKNLSEINDKIESKIQNIKEATQTEELYNTASALLKDSGIKTRIVKQYLPSINKLINHFLQKMNFFVTFTLDESFSETIRSRGRDDFSYDCFSEGEKQRLDLALLFTWRSISTLKNSINTNLLIMDEIFDSYLDSFATENVIELIKSDMFAKNNIFVISHKNDISDKFDKKLVFTKKNNYSMMTI